MTSAQWRSVGLHVVSIGGGAAAAISVAASHSVDLYAAYNHAYAGVKELMAAWAIFGPILALSAGAYFASTRNKFKDVLADPKAPEIARDIPPTPQVVAVANELKKF